LQAKKYEAARAADDEDDAAAASAAASGPSAKEVELARLHAQLAPLGLAVRPVAADGNCLFRAVSDQLSLLQVRTTAAAATATPPDHAGLRRRAAEHIRLHPADFGPFLPYETGDGYPEGETPPPAAVRAAVDAYCARMSRPGVWGGHPELRALATALLTPIVIHEAGAPPVTDPFDRKASE
jgi:OTU domain-containing protein 6